MNIHESPLTKAVVAAIATGATAAAVFAGLSVKNRYSRRLASTEDTKRDQQVTQKPIV
jgi:hypothetical protein